MERFLQIAKANLKFNLYPHLLIAAFMLGISPFLMGIENLDAVRTARVLEMFVALIGIILITPVSLPEQNRDLKELVKAKYTSVTAVVLVRIIEAIICMTILIGGYVLVLKMNRCVFPEFQFYLGTMAEALFLGALGFCTYSFFDQIAVAYMLPVMFYILSFGGGQKLLKDFYLFSMLYGSYDEKINLAICAVVLNLAGLVHPYLYRRVIMNSELKMRLNGKGIDKRLL